MLRKLYLITSLIVLLFCHNLFAQLASEQTLFTLQFNTVKDDLFNLGEPGSGEGTLSGPIVVGNNNLLFYSKKGYALFKNSGDLIDTYNTKNPLKNKPQGDLHLAFPINETEVLFYVKNPHGSSPITIYLKKYNDNKLKELDEEYYTYFKNLDDKYLFNIMHNGITDDMASTFTSRPQLVGYSSLDDKSRNMWALDRYFSLLSPILSEKKLEYFSFFPGINRTVHKHSKNYQYITPLQIFTKDQKDYYCGVYSTAGTEKDRYIQTYYVFDNSGNLMYADTLLKQTNRNAIIGENEKTFYTTRKIESIVYLPTIDSYGNMYYGIVNFVKKMVTVKRRNYYHYSPSPTKKIKSSRLEYEKSITYNDFSLPCISHQLGGSQVPPITIQKKGKSVKALPADLTVDKHLARISRTPQRDIEKKLSRRIRALPKDINNLKKSLVNTSTITCPYSISITGPRGVLNSFSYTNEDVYSARVIGVTKSGTIFVRIDLETYAEILILNPDGTFRNRFTFNRKVFEKRKDIVLLTEKNDLIELDYEKSRRGKFFMWEQKILN